MAITAKTIDESLPIIKETRGLGRLKVNEAGAMEYTEIAVILNTTPDTVRRIETQALKKLRMFQNKGKFEEISETVKEINNRPDTQGLLVPIN